MKPNSSLIAALSPGVVDDANYVKVKTTMQIDDDRYPNIFAAGDVCNADTVKVGFAAFGHATTVLHNIHHLIAEKDGIVPTPPPATLWSRCFGETIPIPALKTHKPVEPQIGIYLGSSESVGQYFLFGKLRIVGNWFMKRLASKNVGADRAWRWLNATKPAEK